MAVADTQLATQVARAQQGQAVVQDFDQASRLANALAQGSVAVPKAFRQQHGACMSVCVQAMGWGMNPVSLIQSAYVVGDQVGYEAKVFAALINLKAPLSRRLRFKYAGSTKMGSKGTRGGGSMKTPTGDRTCTVIGYLHGDDEPFEYTTPPIGEIEPKNSTLWAGDPDRQLAYYATRAWARLYVPEVVLGMFTQDELMDMAAQPEPVKAGQAIQQLIEEPAEKEPEPVDDIEEAELVAEVERSPEPQEEPEAEEAPAAQDDPEPRSAEPEGHSGDDLGEEAEKQVKAARSGLRRRLKNSDTKQQAADAYSWLQQQPGFLHMTDEEQAKARDLVMAEQQALPGDSR